MCSMMKALWNGACLVVAWSALAIPACPAWAVSSWSGSGTNGETAHLVSASATFDVTGSTLTIVLSNTTAGGTLKRGDVLTGLAFDLDGSSTVTLNTISRGGSTIYTSNTATNNAKALSGSWTTHLGEEPLHGYDHGIATTGYGGAFSAGGITRGIGGANYGIVAAGTFPNAGASSSFNSSAFPLIQNSLTFTYAISGSLEQDDINSVAFLFGTAGTGTVTGRCLSGCAPVISNVPEPPMIVLLGTGLVVLGFARARRV